MARRIKEEPIVHQNRIANTAMELFAKNGIDNTKMDEIAKSAGYSKATLYVYFKNKDDIISYLALQSMNKLRDAIESVIKTEFSYKEKFYKLCYALVEYKENYPAFFSMSQKYISVKGDEQNQWDRLSYEAGEEINRLLFDYIDEGINSGCLKAVNSYFETIFIMWGMISGVINLAYEKEDYIRLAGNISKEQFIKDGFERIYNIGKKE